MDEIIKQLWAASEARKVCRIVLEGEPFPRVVHPYGVCQTSRNKIVMVCKQVAGFTKGGGMEGYRNLELNRIRKVAPLDETFQVSTDYDPESVQYKEWIYHI